MPAVRRHQPQAGVPVVALGKAIYTVLGAQKKALDQKQAAVREAMYQTFPPLQKAHGREAYAGPRGARSGS